MKKILASIVFIATGSVIAQVPRISDVEMDLKKPKIIYVAPGRSVIIDFPCLISSAITGIHDDIKIKIGPEKSTSLIIWLSNTFSQPTNLSVRCDSSVFVFDIYPNKYNHQDYINIIDYFKYQNLKKGKLLSSSKSKKWSYSGFELKKVIATSKKEIKEEYKKRKLIFESKKAAF